MLKYKQEWVGIDGGREGLWDPRKWIGVLKVIARHQGEDVYDDGAPIYDELESAFPEENWRHKESASGKRPLFRDYPHPWTRTGVVSLEKQKFALTNLGEKVISGRVSPCDALLTGLKGFTDEESGESPIQILAAAFLAADRPLSLEDVYFGIMRNFRPGVDDITSALKRGEKEKSAIADTSKRRLRHMLKMMAMVGSIQGDDKGYFPWDPKKLEAMACHGGGSLPPVPTSPLNASVVRDLHNDIHDISLRLVGHMELRLLSSAVAKRFVILTGLSGSGKTKIAQAIAHWMTPDSGWKDNADHTTGKKDNLHYVLIPVGADWTGNENIVGYADGLDATKYVTRPALDLIRHATANPKIPHFLILDEMNLSHVERYFADLLSAIESGEPVPLYSGQARKDGNGQDVMDRLTLPGNLFVIGTVNVDETTYMFSPKVLDRANVIEFRMDAAELQAFLANPLKPDLTQLDGNGAGFGEAFVAAASDATAGVPAAVKAQYEAQMQLFFGLLRSHGGEYGYRVAHETARFMHFYHQLGGFGDGVAWFDAAMDAVIVQKFLPKLHGSRAKLGPLLKKLWQACILPPAVGDLPAELKQIAEAAAPNSKDAEPSATVPAGARYPISAEKIARMWRLLADNGFASFAEA